MVICIIGMSASGKTTLGRSIYKLLKSNHPGVVFIDGDIVRDIMGNDLGHAIEDRRKNTDRISRLCLHLDQQEINVVCAVLSIFHESQRWNREHFSSYKEIYIEASFDTLRRRDIKGLYDRALSGEIENVVGVDIEFQPPYAPDLVINNDRDNVHMDDLAMKALDDLGVDSGTGSRLPYGNRFKAPEKPDGTEYDG